MRERESSNPNRFRSLRRGVDIAATAMHFSSSYHEDSGDAFDHLRLAINAMALDGVKSVA